MVKLPMKHQHRLAKPLESRHLFLDTQVYRALGHNPANRAMALLKDQVASHRVVLHTTDITLLEVRRQIRERVLARQRELNAIEKDMRRWRMVSPNTVPNNIVELDAEALSDKLFSQFEQFLRYDCKANVHQALEVTPASVFAAYFDRKPPFDGEDSKEFPDGFVLEALRQWCRDQGDQMHIVTEDKAMLRAVAADERLLPLKDIHEVLARAAAELGADGESAAEDVLHKPAFDFSFEEALSAQIEEVIYIYVGDLAEGEAYAGEFVSIEEIGDWSVVSLNDRRVTLIVDAKVKVLVEVQYEDRDGAFYDREDDRWFGTENASTQIENEIGIEILIEVDRKSGLVRDAKILTQEVPIYDSYDWEK